MTDRDCMKPVCATLTLPDPATLMAEFGKRALQTKSLARYLDAFARGTFVYPDGRFDPLKGVGITPSQAALVSHLALGCPSQLSFETGFGMGTSATVILGTRHSLGRPFEHFAFDPSVLPEQRGLVTALYLSNEFEDHFRMVRERSEIGAAKLLDERGRRAAGLIFIDGSHHMETVMTDFRLADLLCCYGGFIVFDDAAYPAIETVINYIRCNRADYAVAHLPVPNMSLLQKRGPDLREWYTFTPFPVPDRLDWTPTRRDIDP